MANRRSLSLEEAQEILVDLLELVDRACRREGIPYWLDSGSLLGAVRNGTFIPWDDDIDVCALREDLPRLLAVLRRDVQNDNVRVMTADDMIMSPTAKVCLIHTEGRSSYAVAHGFPEIYESLSVDIFAMDAVSDSAIVRWLQGRVGSALGAKPRAEYMARSSAEKNRSKRLVWYIISTIPQSVADRITVRMLKHSRSLNSNWISKGLDCVFASKYHPRGDVFPLGSANFEGLRVSAPANPANYLRQLYGADFMTPPPPEHQVQHFDRLTIEDI